MAIISGLSHGLLKASRIRLRCLLNAQVATKKSNISGVIDKRKQMKRSVRCVVAKSGIGIFCFLSQFVNSALNHPFRSACSETTFILTSMLQTNSRGLALMEFPFVTSVNNGESSKLTFRRNLTSPPRAIFHEPCMSALYQATAVYFKGASPGTNVT